jgi:hemolysin activation/secretion protein
VPLSPHQDFGARAIGGWSQGVLPPQRQFAIGGIGSVHGYGFKEAVGNDMALLNLEYALGWRGAFQVLGFFDVGRAGQPGVDARWLKGVGFGFGIWGARLEFGYKLEAIPSSLQLLLRFGRTF